MKKALIAVFLLALIAVAVSNEIQVWKECRRSNSWAYCMRVLG